MIERWPGSAQLINIAISMQWFPAVPSSLTICTGAKLQRAAPKGRLFPLSNAPHHLAGSRKSKRTRNKDRRTKTSSAI